jgi:hypothetical protein
LTWLLAKLHLLQLLLLLSTVKNLSLRTCS